MARSDLVSTEQDVINFITDDVAEDETTDDIPAYELIGAGSIPVSKKAGKRWQKKIKQTMEVTETEHDKWSETFRLYRITGDEGGERTSTRKHKYLFSEDTDENMVRTNVKKLLQITYTRNPTIEVSSTDKVRKPLAKVLKLAVNALLNKKTAPGMNAKAKIRRHICHGHLTNFGVLKLVWQSKQGSQGEAINQLHRVQKELAAAKDTTVVEDLYAQLEQIEDELPLHNVAGMSLKNVLPHRLIVDPKTTQIDLSDANWVAEEVFLDKDYINNRYYNDTDDGSRKRISDNKEKDLDTTLVADVETKVLETILEASSIEREEYLQKGKVKCYLIWDKLTKQISLFEDEDWSYPLWVFSDTMQLSRFYPYFIMAFSEPVDGIVQPGETSQYIGHQREINKINNKAAHIRDSAFGALIYNSKEVKGETVKKLITHMENPTKLKAFGIDWDPELDFEKIFKVFVPPSFAFKDLFDKTDLTRVANQMSGISDIQRGEQFKTNTTNKAVSAISEQIATATSELTDIVEDVLDELAWAICEILISKYDKEEIAKLIGATAAEEFTPMDVEEFNNTFNLTIVAGSTEKPSTSAKKQEAMQIAQALGQVGQAAPSTVIKLITRLFTEAFSEFIFTDEDAKSLETEAQANLTKGVSTPQSQPQPKPQGKANATGQ